MDVDVMTGRVTDFSTEYHGGYTQPGYSYGFVAVYEVSICSLKMESALW